MAITLRGELPAKVVVHTDRGTQGEISRSSQHLVMRWCSMVRRQEASDRAVRPAMRSCGRPYPPRHVEQEFWRRIAEGTGSEDAAVAVGVSAPVGSRWFRNGGGMPPITLAAPRADTCPSLSERGSRF